MQRKLIVSVILIVLVIISFSDLKINGVEIFEDYFQQMETDSMNLLKGNYISFDGESDIKASKEVSLKLEATDVDLLRIMNMMGSINISGEDREDVEGKAVITLYADTIKHARDYVEMVELRTKKKEGILEFALPDQDYPRYVKAIKVDYTIKAPHRLALKLFNKYGEMKVANFAGKVDIENQYEALRVEDIDGEARLEARYGNLYASNIKGPAYVRTAYNQAQIEDLGDNLSLHGSYSKIWIAGVKGDTEYDCKYGLLEMDDMGGNVEGRSRYTAIKGFTIKGKTTVDSNYGRIELYDIENDVNAKGRYTEMILKLKRNLNDYTVNCEAYRGEIRTNLPFDVSKNDSRRYLSGKKGDGSVLIELETDYDEIHIQQ